MLNSPNREELSELEEKHLKLQEEERLNKLRLDSLSTPLRGSWGLQQLDKEGHYSPPSRFSSPIYESHTDLPPPPETPARSPVSFISKHGPSTPHPRDKKTIDTII